MISLTIKKLTVIAMLSAVVGNIAISGSSILPPMALGSVVGGATLVSIFAGIYLAREE